MNIGVTDLFWVFIVLTSLQPVLKQRLLEASRRNLIAEIERKRGSRVILLAHWQETMSFLGFPSGAFSIGQLGKMSSRVETHW